MPLIGNYKLNHFSLAIGPLNQSLQERNTVTHVVNRFRLYKPVRRICISKEKNCKAFLPEKSINLTSSNLPRTIRYAENISDHITADNH